MSEKYKIIIPARLADDVDENKGQKERNRPCSSFDIVHMNCSFEKYAKRGIFWIKDHDGCLLPHFSILHELDFVDVQDDLMMLCENNDFSGLHHLFDNRLQFALGYLCEAVNRKDACERFMQIRPKTRISKSDDIDRYFIRERAHMTCALDFQHILQNDPFICFCAEMNEYTNSTFYFVRAEIDNSFSLHRICLWYKYERVGRMNIKQYKRFLVAINRIFKYDSFTSSGSACELNLPFGGDMHVYSDDIDDGIVYFNRESYYRCRYLLSRYFESKRASL